MKITISQRIESLRCWMAAKGVKAFIIPSADPHLSEYVSSHWHSREWISGFTGSAGTVVITDRKAGLWTDSRYFLQATQQIEGSELVLFKEMLPDTPSIPAFLMSELQAGEAVGIDGRLFSADAVEAMKKALSSRDIELRSLPDPMEELWQGRPSQSMAPAFIHALPYAGRTCADKLADIRSRMSDKEADFLLLSALDEVAWTLNLRGTDVHCNPVVTGYLLVSAEETHFFIAPEKVTSEVADYLSQNGVSLHAYEEIMPFISHLHDAAVWMDTSKTNYAVCAALPDTCRIVKEASPVALLKAVRNEQEIKGIRMAMQRDGVALVKFQKWLEEAVPKGGETELSITQKLHEFRAAQPLFQGDSFDTIAGYGEHGAIVHYEATPETDVELKPKGFLLIDSGAQYLDGTTDITRTIALGDLTEEEKTDYTLILKGHIDLAMAVFPEGTRGAQLDVLARMPIWQHRMNYLHGTGHGVGHFLNVHEGPQSIRMNENPVVLLPGMLTSNEPGLYKAGKHGIRIENLVLTVKAGEGMFGGYLKFETVTLCPICKKGILKELLEEKEISWLNEYHERVYEELSPSLDAEEQSWLRQACEAI